jgi:type IV secretory pathway VirJ component
MPTGACRHRPARRLATVLLASGCVLVASCGPSARKGAPAECGSAAAAFSQGGSPGIADLPLIEVPACGASRLVAILITGDGGWANADRGLSDALAARGVFTVALDAPRYLAQPRTPDGAAQDLDRILRHYLTDAERERVVVIGYSRGADLAPFMVSRLPTELRRRIALVALLSPSEWAGFQFHLIDLVTNIQRSGDRSVPEEVERLRGTPVLCIYGRGDRGAICPTVDSVLARPIVRAGGHGVERREGPALADTILAAVIR